MRFGFVLGLLALCVSCTGYFHVESLKRDGKGGPSFVDKGSLWPVGTEGDLLVLNGQTRVLGGGLVHDFQNCQIDAGAVLEIAATSAWTVLGCRGNLVLNGQIVARKFTAFESGELEVETLDGLSLSADFIQTEGGRGGNSNSTTYGLAAFGNGGGASSSCGPGASGLGAGGNASSSVSGSGTRSFVEHFFDSRLFIMDPADDVAAPGVAAFTGASVASVPVAAAYENGFYGYAVPQSGPDPEQADGPVYAAAGAGGRRGYHGALLYLRVGASLSGSGNIDASGTDGGHGGGGRAALDVTTQRNSCGGGGGGGGAGGNGGHVVVRAASVDGFSGQIDVAAGAAGSGGAGGPAGGAYLIDGEAGVNGAPGQSGSYDLDTWTPIWELLPQ